jgi:hypothetical protein
VPISNTHQQPSVSLGKANWDNKKDAILYIAGACGNHAETIRSIWASRCKKVFEDAHTHFVELKAKLVAQIEYKLTIHANLLQSRPKKAKALEDFKRVWTLKIPILNSLHFNNKS